MRSLAISRLGVSALVLLIAGLSGCLGTSEGDKPQSARVTISGTTTTSLQLVTSNDFYEQIIGGTVDIQAVFNTSDTTTVPTLPFEQTIALNELGSIVVRLIQPDSTPSDVSMQVLLDGRLQFDRQATLSSGGALEYRFVWTSF